MIRKIRSFAPEEMLDSLYRMDPGEKTAAIERLRAKIAELEHQIDVLLTIDVHKWNTEATETPVQTADESSAAADASGERSGADDEPETFAVEERPVRDTGESREVEIESLAAEIQVYLNVSGPTKCSVIAEQVGESYQEVYYCLKRRPSMFVCTKDGQSRLWMNKSHH